MLSSYVSFGVLPLAAFGQLLVDTASGSIGFVVAEKFGSKQQTLVQEQGINDPRRSLEEMSGEEQLTPSEHLAQQFQQETETESSAGVEGHVPKLLVQGREMAASPMILSDPNPYPRPYAYCSKRMRCEAEQQLYDAPTNTCANPSCAAYFFKYLDTSTYRCEYYPAAPVVLVVIVGILMLLDLCSFGT